VVVGAERLLGAEHPATLTTRALSYTQVARIEEAIAIQERRRYGSVVGRLRRPPLRILIARTFSREHA
jgi:hypothetical protein